MGKIESRVEKLETRTRAGEDVVMFAMSTESDDDCIRRHGHTPEVSGVSYTVFRWAASVPVGVVRG